MAKAKTPDGRNRSALAKAAGRTLVAYTISAETAALIERAREHLAGLVGRATKVQALEWLVREGGKKIPRKSSPGID